ncbi:hypothetical protein LTR08_004607 [Meristemomyces frigidus]|nr:hypothetical protein LTR08_004607 [Meristemomyces frigidus]
MKDLDSRMPPALKAVFAGSEDILGMHEVHDVPDTLKEHAIDLSSINAVIWSHAHIDHVGDPSVFPPTTELVVGPGLKASCLPGYPTNPDAFVLDSAFDGRSVREVDFANSTMTIGGFRAVDFFDDGAFWLLEAPGHTGHHICGLCRTTEDSWIFLGSDACHNVAQLRPRQFRPLPDSVPASLLGSFYGLAPGMHEDLAAAEETVGKLKAFDGREDVIVVIAHDATLLEVLDFFPLDLNSWRLRAWSAEARWLFLKEFDRIAAV